MRIVIGRGPAEGALPCTIPPPTKENNMTKYTEEDQQFDKSLDTAFEKDVQTNPPEKTEPTPNPPEEKGEREPFIDPVPHHPV